LKKSGDAMPYPAKLSQEMFDSIAKNASQEQNNEPNEFRVPNGILLVPGIQY
jgi:hypothetical protein